MAFLCQVRHEALLPKGRRVNRTAEFSTSPSLRTSVYMHQAWGRFWGQDDCRCLDLILEMPTSLCSGAAQFVGSRDKDNNSYRLLNTCNTEGAIRRNSVNYLINSHNDPSEQILSILFDKWGNWGSSGLSNLSEVMPLVCSRSTVRSQVWFQDTFFSTKLSPSEKWKTPRWCQLLHGTWPILRVSIAFIPTRCISFTVNLIAL